MKVRIVHRLPDLVFAVAVVLAGVGFSISQL